MIFGKWITTFSWREELPAMSSLIIRLRNALQFINYFLDANNSNRESSKLVWYQIIIRSQRKNKKKKKKTSYRVIDWVIEYIWTVFCRWWSSRGRWLMRGHLWQFSVEGKPDVIINANGLYKSHRRWRPSESAAGRVPCRNTK